MLAFRLFLDTLPKEKKKDKKWIQGMEMKEGAFTAKAKRKGITSAQLKGCHEVQNLGASITYITRYLLVMALAICEHDALDATTGSEEPKSAKPITKSVFDTLDEQSQDEIRSYAADIILMIHKDQVAEAVEYINSLELDADWKTALWSQLDSKQRSAIKKFTKG